MGEEERVIIEEDTSRKTSKKNILLTVLKKHKIGLLLIVFLLTVSGTFAWFVYNKTVDMSLHAHVKAWNIELGDDDGDTYVIEIDDLYPGMTTIDTKNGGGIPITNNGEIAANIQIDIVSITLFGELQDKEKQDYVLEETTTSEGKKFTVKGYPFVLSFTLSSDYLTSGSSTTLNYSLEWVYEKDSSYDCTFKDDDGNVLNDCDAQDTYFGEKSYAFSSDPAHINEPSLVIQMKMNVTQAN